MKNVTDEQYGQWKNFSHDLDKRILSGSLCIKDLKRVIAPLIGQKPVNSKFGPPLKEIEFVVPEDYDHSNQLESFGCKTKDLKSIYHYNDNLTDENFSKVSHKLVPGKTYTVKFIPINSLVSSQDCLEEYKRQNAVLVGAQGLTTLQETHSNEFPAGKYFLSFDEEENLWKDADGYHRVPYVDRYSDGGWLFGLVYFGGAGDSGGILVVFCETETSDS